MLLGLGDTYCTCLKRDKEWEHFCDKSSDKTWYIVVVTHVLFQSKSLIFQDFIYGLLLLSWRLKHKLSGILIKIL